MGNRVFLGLVVLAIGVLAGWYLLRTQSSIPGLTTQQTNQQPTPTGSVKSTPTLGAINAGLQTTKGGTVERTVVIYTNSGFAPSPVTVGVGSTVTFVNNSSREMWVASDVYPTNQLLPGFDAHAATAKNGTYDYTFTKIGTWRYHNQVNPSDVGVVEVKK